MFSWKQIFINVYFSFFLNVVCFQTERHFIMQVVCEATQCPDTRVSNIRKEGLKSRDLNEHAFTFSKNVLLSKI